MASGIESPGKERNSNLELYRIVCMLMIVAHHYVANSGLAASDGPITQQPTSLNSLYLSIFGMWGKTGINCFLLITGYFMCKKTITIRKFTKLLTSIYFYKILIFSILLIFGYETLSAKRVLQIISPIWGLNSNFVSCFIVFWLTIPFWNILIRHMTKQQHKSLLLLLLGSYTLLGSMPTFHVAFNYVSWFGILYLTASYIRLYPKPIYENRKLWLAMTVGSVMLAILSVSGIQYLFGFQYAHFFVSDSNKFLAVIVSISSFLLFKGLPPPHTKVINPIGASTFGVLLIHANSDAMRTWLWKDTVNCVGHYSLPILSLAGYTFGVVILIFGLCICIDRLRIMIIEKPFFRWYDRVFNR